MDSLSNRSRAILSSAQKRTLLAELLQKKAGQAKHFPLSFAQQRLWFLSQLAPDSPFYNIARTISLTGPLSVLALEQSLNELVRRHEAMRTRFAVIEGMPVQVIDPVQRLPLSVGELTTLPEAHREVQVRRLTREEAQRPFDLARGPLVRARLLRLGTQAHVLLLSMHHIIADDWSLGVFFRELSALYAAFSAGQPSPLPALLLHYADYTLWQREWFTGSVQQAQLAYWRHRLADLLPIELPQDRPRPTIQTFAGAYEPFHLSPKVATQLRVLSQREGVTLFMTLLAGFQVLLARYSGRKEIVVGTAIANRRRSELEGLIGLFLNTLVLRTDLSGDPSVHEFLKRVREVALEAYAHQDFPFEKLVEELHPQRDPGRNPLFQVMISLQNAPHEPLELSGLKLHISPIHNGTTKLDLHLLLWEDAEGLSGVVEYSTDLFEASTIQRMIGHYQQVLASMTTHFEQRISALSLLTGPEVEQLRAWNATATTYPESSCLHQLIEAQVVRTPEAIAVSFQGAQLTYRELNARANQVAHWLQSLGVETDMLVGICLERSLEMIIGLVGILKARGAYVPFDPEYPHERLAFMLQDAQVSLLLTKAHLQSSLTSHEAHLLCLDTDWPSLAGLSVENPVRAGEDPQDTLAYMIYTSGSTGKPKGTMNTHRGICNRLLWMQETYQLQPGDRVLQKTPFSFDVSVWEFFWPLICGARLVLARPGGHRESTYLLEVIAREQITILHFVPSMLSAFLENPEVVRCQGVKRVICSGEALSVELQERFFAYFGVMNAGSPELHNLYGPTEAAVDVTYWACQREDRRASVPIGRPIANTQIYLLDGHLQPVPVGVPGCLYIGGIGLARGYFRQPGQTAERFIPHHLGQKPGERLYQTGDLARYRSDGTIEYIGRLDHQVKIRGFRIELQEIEAVLNQYPGVRQCVISVQEYLPEDKRLIAHIVADEAQHPSQKELQQFLKTQLPTYMLPSTYLFLKELPLTANGKVDRTALPLAGSEECAQDEHYIAPRSPTEELLATIWAELLGLEQVGVFDDFFEAGGHSLSAIRLLSQISTTFQIDLTVRDIFEAPTIAELSTRIVRHYAEQAGSEILAELMTEIEQFSEEEAHTLLASQQPERGEGSVI